MNNAMKKGFTLIETLTVIGIISFVIVGLVYFMMYSLQSYSFSFAQFDATGRAKTAMTRLIRDVREARTGENGGWPIIEATDNSITFYSDITNDGKADRVRYFLDGTDFKRGVVEPSGSPVSYPPASEKISFIASGVNNGTSPVFTFYNGNWPADQINNPLPPANRIIGTRYIKVYLKIKSSASSQTGAFDLTTGVNIRSLKDNL